MDLTDERKRLDALETWTLELSDAEILASALEQPPVLGSQLTAGSERYKGSFVIGALSNLQLARAHILMHDAKAAQK